LGLSHKESQESQKFGKKIEAENPPQVPPCARGNDWKEAKFRGMKSPLMKERTNDRKAS